MIFQNFIHFKNIRAFYTLSHNLINEKLIGLIDKTFQRETAHYIACNDINAFFKSEEHIGTHYGLSKKVCEAVTFLLDNICIRFGT